MRKSVSGFDVRIPPLPAAGMSEQRPEHEIVRVEVRDPNVLRLLDENGNIRRFEQLEAETLRFALAYYRGQMSAVARKLGIGRSTLYRKLKEYGLQQGETDSASAKEGNENDAAA